jgi:SNF2 family DNA or RNA helicase
MAKFIVVLKEHTFFGYLFSAYHIERELDYVTEIKYQLTFEDAERNKMPLTDFERELLKTIDSYSDQNLQKIFSRKKTLKEFLQTLKSEDVEKRIRPFIEKRLLAVIEKLKKTSIPFFFKKDKFSTLYKEDIIKIEHEPAVVVFNIRKNETGTDYYLSVKHSGNTISLFRQKGIILVNEPCVLILNGHLYNFTDIDGKKLMPFFDKNQISVPKSAENKWFKAFAVKAIKQYEVEASGFTIEEANINIKPVLKLEKDWKNEFVFVLYFKYGDDYYLMNDSKTGKLLFDENKFLFTKILRDETKEILFAEKIKEFGLEVHNDSGFKIPLLKTEKLFQQQKTIEWLINHEHLFKQNDIEFVQDLYNKEYFTEKISVNVNLEQKKDWFDIYGNVIFGDFEVPFINLKNHILNQIREYILPDKTVALIPEEWFAKYSDIFLFGISENAHLKISKTHFESVYTAQIHGIDKSFRESTSKLIAFKEFETFVSEHIHAKLRPYQKEGLKWMSFLQENNFGGCLADDMGLGKTLQSICLIQNTIEKQKPVLKSEIYSETNKTQLSLFEEPLNLKQKASLIVMPVSLIHNWKKEIKTFAPNLKVLSYQGNNRHRYLSRLHQFDIILIGYSLLRNDIDFLKKYDFLYFILDESQYIKNPTSKIYQAVSEIQSDYRMVLTGTPIENSLSDLWAQMNFINNGMLGDFRFFNEAFIKPIEKNRDEIQQEKLKRIISPFILRRTKQEVATDLPPLTQQTIYISMDDEQKSVYEREKSKIRNHILELIETGQKKSLSIEVLSAVNKLRQIANHPVMTDKNYIGSSGKFSEIIRNIENITSESHKVLIFSSYVKHLKLFAEYFAEQHIKFSMLTGQTKNREDVINEFQKDKLNQIFLISIKAGGTGLNLTEADYVFVIDPWWNPAVEQQAVNRAHRIGQDKKVMVYRYISKNTIEEKISKLQEKKSKLADSFINNKNSLLNFSEDKILSLFD